MAPATAVGAAVTTTPIQPLPRHKTWFPLGKFVGGRPPFFLLYVKLLLLFQLVALRLFLPLIILHTLDFHEPKVS